MNKTHYHITLGIDKEDMKKLVDYLHGFERIEINLLPENTEIHFIFRKIFGNLLAAIHDKTD
jgi:hypothetical protein